MERAVMWRARHFSGLVKRSGEAWNPAVVASTSVKGAVKASLVATPFAVVCGYLVSPWLLLIASAPLVPLLSPELRLRDRVAQRREGVERELPFFSVVVNVLAGAGVPLYTIMRDIAKNGAFEGIGREALFVSRDVNMFGMTPIDSLERLAANHPSAKFGDFLLGYTSKVRSGGDVAAYLSSESGALLESLEEGWSRYVARVGVVGSMMITAFGVVPLLLMVVGVFSPAFSAFGLIIFTGVGVPLVTVCLLLLAGRMQPAQGERVTGRPWMSLALGLPGILLGVPLASVWVSAAAFLVIFFTAYGLSVRKELAARRDLEEGLVQFLKDLLEYKRQEYDLARAVVAIEANGKYNGVFEEFLAHVTSQLRAGVPLDEVKVECQSRIGRLVFLALGQMSRSGGGTVDTVYQISRFAERMREMKRSASAEMKPYLILSYISPLLLAFGVAFVGGILSSFSTVTRAELGGASLGAIQIGRIPQNMAQVSDLLIVVTAAALGLVGAKMTDMTVRNTLKASINVALAVAAIALMGALGSHSLAQALGH